MMRWLTDWWNDIALGWIEWRLARMTCFVVGCKTDKWDDPETCIRGEICHRCYAYRSNNETDTPWGFIRRHGEEA